MNLLNLKPIGYINLARSYMSERVGGFSTARSILMEYVDMPGTRRDANISELLGCCNLYLDDYDSARSNLEEALGIDPRRVDSLYLLGIVYLIADDLENAKDSFRDIFKRENGGYC